MSVKRLYLAIVLSHLFNVLHGQDTVISIPEFVKSDTAPVHLEGSFHYRVDSLSTLDRMPMFTLSEALSAETPVYIKSYGPGLLATPSFRGGDANHTIVLWNGSKLNSPMLGHTDLSLVPVSFFGSMDVFTGSSSNLYSTGGIGGGLLLSQQPDLQRFSASASAQAGSFGELGLQGAVNVPLKVMKMPLSLAAGIDALRRENNFPYLDIYSSPYERKLMEHAWVQRSNALVSVSAMPATRLLLQVSYWYSTASRQLPNPINLGYASRQTQQDTAHRVQAIVKWAVSEKASLRLLSLLDENTINFSDPRTGEKNSNQFTSVQSQLEFGYAITPTTHVKAIASIMSVTASSKNYEGLKSLGSLSALASLKKTFFREMLTVEGGSRFEQYRDYTGIMPFAGLGWLPSKESPVKLLASYAETFRMPTLNELYWSPGGNPDLEPERGKTIEAGLASIPGKAESRSVYVDYKIVYFNGVYMDRIRWLPQGALFSPVNVAQSSVSGIDLVSHLVFRFSGLEIKPGVNAEFANATGKLDSSTGTQTLSYVPQLIFSAGAEMKYKGSSLFYGHTYTGKRFITNDETAYMPAYNTAMLSCFYHVQACCRIPLSIGLSVNNVWDTNYQNLPWRPMPGRAFTFILKYRFS